MLINNNDANRLVILGNKIFNNDVNDLAERGVKNAILKLIITND